MPIEILMPALSPTMEEGNLVKWMKKEGDEVLAGQVIAEIETDKATMEVEAVDEGILGRIVVPEGTESVKVNSVIAVLIEEGESVDDIKIDDSAQKEEQAPKEEKVEEPKQEEKQEEKKIESGDRVFASPLAKRLAADKGVDISKVEGSGPHGRVIKDDIENIKSSSGSKAPSTPVAQSSGRVAEEYTKIPNNNMRKIIAQRLQESKQKLPHFYLEIECNLDKLMQARKDMNSATTDPESPAYKLSVNDFMIKAIAMALHEVPDANASWTEEAVLRYNNVDVSVAVAIDGGLITPIVKNADQKSISAISNEMKDLAKRAREGSLSPEEFQGGSFTISNLGMYGIKKFSAIINPPQGCIMAVGMATKRPVVLGDEIKAAMMLDITLSCDHRVVDGAIGANFLAAFKRFIENPMLMFV